MGCLTSDVGPIDEVTELEAIEACCMGCLTSDVGPINEVIKLEAIEACWDVGPEEHRLLASDAVAAVQECVVS